MPARRTAAKPEKPAPRTPHGSRPDQVYARLRALIVDGRLSPGSRIVETEIAERLGVSRTPVREALQRLQQEGYVTGPPGAQQSRLTVAPLTRDDVHDLLGVIGALEGLAARDAALLDDGGRKALVKVLRATNAEFHRAGRAPTTEQSKVFDADERFHAAVVAASGGPRLRSLHDAVKPQAERYIRMYISMLTGNIKTSVEEHEFIITAIEDGRAVAAQEAVLTNWRHAADRIDQAIRALGERGSW